MEVLFPPPSPPSGRARGGSTAGRTPSCGLASPQISREELLPRNQACRARATSPFKAASASSAPAPLIPDCLEEMMINQHPLPPPCLFFIRFFLKGWRTPSGADTQQVPTHEVWGIP